MKVNTGHPTVVQIPGPGTATRLQRASMADAGTGDEPPVDVTPACRSSTATTYVQGGTVEVYKTIARLPQPEPVPESAETSRVGRQLLVSRLYGVREPAVFDGSRGMSLEDMARSDYVYLTQPDRQLLSDVYAYAQANDIDLWHIDLIASDIGNYRRHDNGRRMISFNSGGHFDLQGRQLSVDFNPKDAATAARLLNGPVLSSTRFDQGFLRYILDPGFGAVGHVGQFDVLEHVVNRFSAQAADTAPPGNRFATGIAPAMGEKCIVTASNEVRAPNFKSRDSGEADLPALDEENQSRDGVAAGRSSRSSFLLKRLADGIEILRRWNEADRRATIRDSLWKTIRQR